MEKQRKWQFFLILSVIVLTIYNILPTLFYYIKPLRHPADQKIAEQVAQSIIKRVNHLEDESVDWIRAYCKCLQIRPISLSIDQENRQMITLSFAKLEEAKRLRSMLPRAGSLIPFPPSQMTLAPQEETSKEVLIQKKIPFLLQTDHFTYFPKEDRTLLIDRIQQIALALTGPNETSEHLNALEQGNPSPAILEALAAQINTLRELFEEDSPLAKRYAACFAQGLHSDRKVAIQTLINAFDRARDTLRKEKHEMGGSEAGALDLLQQREDRLVSAEMYLKKHLALFSSGNDAWSLDRMAQAIETSDSLDLSNANPLFSSLSVDTAKNQIILKFHPEALAYRANGAKKELFEQLVIDEIARISRQSNEEVVSGETEVSIPLSRLSNVSGYLALDLQKLAKEWTRSIQASLQSQWIPKHPDLQYLKIVDHETYEVLPPEQKAICLVITSPLAKTDPALSMMKPDAFYVVAKGIDRIVKNYELFPQSPIAQEFNVDFRKLIEILYREGFHGVAVPSMPGSIAQTGDYLFEKPDVSTLLLAATREDFTLRGGHKIALLELSDLEQRILTENKIENSIHQDLVKWRDEYRSSQINLNSSARFDVPKPTKSVFWSNLALSARKYIRGDERKILRWGLDLSGGKTVQIALRDANRQLVTNDADLKQGINELYKRVNKMGVSEVSIRQVGSQIVLDFPGSQALSASELIKSSTMYFHLVNEKYSLSNPTLAEHVNRFLQTIWNEACVTGQKDSRGINAIAIKHLSPEKGELRSEAARILWDHGLRLASVDDEEAESTVSDLLSKVVSFRGSSANDWQGQSHPLLIVMRNWALEGANLENIQAGYDPSKGNFLQFDVASSYETPGGRKIQPRNILSSWTSRYSKENILGTPLEFPSKGRGWRMAVLLNDSVISAPSLDSPLRDRAMISGSFSQREVNQLAADLKAGSLTFTPQILSEKNVSPELGKADRCKGIAATLAALILIIGSMTIYYRFAGAVASVAVLFNLLILWATLQNLGAALTLAGLAGIILTVAMAVDANVLVYERIKEEFAESKAIGPALSGGYRKAYSAIVDSNITTIIAALILLNFDAGPIKSFAVNLIIGIASSMFTALFMTRFYFMRWARNPKHKELKMADWIGVTRFNFLKMAKPSFLIAAAIILVGGSLMTIQRSRIFGMDFTGGYALNLEFDRKDDASLVNMAENALLAAGAAKSDFQIRELNSPNHLRILFGTVLEQPGKPFYQMPIESEKTGMRYGYEKNPRIEWILNALQKEGLSIAKHTLPSLDTSWTAMSGQMSDSMRNHALLGLLIAFLCIFVYLAFRFEYKFAAAALICLLHDVLITLGFIGLLPFFGVDIQIDLNTIAALMTIVGYSLNDTIIIFDRIREELRLNPNGSLVHIVNHALNATLSRTTITSGTTLLVLISLVILGGPSIFGFALVMTVGVFFGTLSSWFIASPLMILFHKKETEQSLPC